MHLLSSRRLFLRQGLGWLGWLLSGLWPDSAVAARLAEYFSASRLDDALAGLFAGQPLIDSPAITLSVPDIAEDGAAVPVTISSALKNIRRVYILVENNPTPLTAEFELADTVSAYIAARIKMAASSHVLVIAEHESRLLKTRQWVTVVQGGCGSG
ncbi:MAG: thiosulfate oxidation carrier protein SoxY [Methylococcales bacterium]|nr:thiosulfate oxidation carrier protein SoxY [Methylococcales bacterium]